MQTGPMHPLLTSVLFLKLFPKPSKILEAPQDLCLTLPILVH